MDRGSECRCHGKGVVHHEVARSVPVHASWFGWILCVTENLIISGNAAFGKAEEYVNSPEQSHPARSLVPVAAPLCVCVPQARVLENWHKGQQREQVHCARGTSKGDVVTVNSF